MVPPKGPCPNERISEDARGNYGGGGGEVGGGVGGREVDIAVDMWEVDC